MTPGPDDSGGAVGRYIVLGLEMGRHIDGLVDAYYGPPALAERVAGAPSPDPGKLVEDSRALIAALDGGAILDGEPGTDTLPGPTGARRRRWLRAQTVGLLTTARKLAGEHIGYEEEVESCYGVRPQPVPEEELAAAHQV